MDWEVHRCCMFDVIAACHKGESQIQCCGNIMAYDGHQVPSICQACSSHGELQMWFSLVGFKVGWISHNITNQHITLLKLPNFNTTLLHCGINVCGMHYTCLFQQSSLRLWPSHNLLLAFFTFSHFLSTFATLATARWYPKSWTTLKAWRKLLSRNANNLELVFFAGFATSTGCILFDVTISFGCSCPCWTIRMQKNAYVLVTGSSHQTRWYVHWTTSPCMCVDVHQCVVALLGLVLQSKKLNLFRYCILRLRPSCCCNHYIHCSNTSRQQEIHRPPLHMNLNSFADLANKTLKTMFVRYEVAITNLLPFVPTYTARHPQSMLTGIRFASNRWSYNMVISLVVVFVGQNFVLRWLKILVVKELAPRSWLVTTFHLLFTFV